MSNFETQMKNEIKVSIKDAFLLTIAASFFGAILSDRFGAHTMTLLFSLVFASTIFIGVVVAMILGSREVVVTYGRSPIFNWYDQQNRVEKYTQRNDGGGYEISYFFRAKHGYRYLIINIE